MPCHNFPLTVFPHPDICEAPFPAKRLAVFVLAYGMVLTIRNREVPAVYAHVEGRIARTGERFGFFLNVFLN